MPMQTVCTREASVNLDTLDRAMTLLRKSIREADDEPEPAADEKLSKSLERRSKQLDAKAARADQAEREAMSIGMERSLEKTSFKKVKGSPQVPGRGALRRPAPATAKYDARQAVVGFTNSIYSELLPLIDRFKQARETTTEMEQKIWGQGLSSTGEPHTASRITDRTGLKAQMVKKVLADMAGKGLVSKAGSGWTKVPGAKLVIGGEYVKITPEFGKALAGDVQKASKFLDSVREFGMTDALTSTDKRDLRRLRQNAEHGVAGAEQAASAAEKKLSAKMVEDRKSVV